MVRKWGSNWKRILIEMVMRVIDRGSGYGTRALISYENEAGGEIKRFNEEGFIYADAGFFEFFTFPIIQGTAGEVLNRNGSSLRIH